MSATEELDPVFNPFLEEEFLEEENAIYMKERTYLSESHRKRSEACQKAVEKMLKHPLSRERAILQIETIKRLAEEKANRK